MVDSSEFTNPGVADHYHWSLIGAVSVQSRWANIRSDGPKPFQLAILGAAVTTLSGG